MSRLVGFAAWLSRHVGLVSDLQLHYNEVESDSPRHVAFLQQASLPLLQLAPELCAQQARAAAAAAQHAGGVAAPGLQLPQLRVCRTNIPTPRMCMALAACNSLLHRSLSRIALLAGSHLGCVVPHHTPPMIGQLTTLESLSLLLLVEPEQQPPACIAAALAPLHRLTDVF